MTAVDEWGILKYQDKLRHKMRHKERCNSSEGIGVIKPKKTLDHPKINKLHED